MKSRTSKGALSFALAGFLAGTLSSSGGVTIGNAAVDRGTVDGASQVTFLDVASADTIATAGTLTGWQVYAGRAGTVSLEVYEPVTLGYKLVGEDTVSPTAAGVYDYSSSISVSPGDILGFRYNGSGVVSFNDGGPGMVAWTAYPDGGAYDPAVGGTIPSSAFQSIEPRTYSLNATIEVPEPTTVVLAGLGALALALATLRPCRSSRAKLERLSERIE